MSSPRVSILVADPLAPDGIEMLSQVDGFEIDNRPGLKEHELKEIIGKYDAVLVRSGCQISAELIAHGTKLKVIGRAGIGIDNVDVEAASKAGIVVMNTPQGNMTTTAEHAIALLMSLARRIPQACASMKGGAWEKSKFKGVEITDKVLGIIGLGNIGRIVATRANGLRMKVIAFDPVITQKKADECGAELVDFDTLLRQSDFISIHVPLNDKTQNLLNAAAFDKMKKGVRIINAARGGIVDEEALTHALDAGIVAGAALDVFQSEPPAPNDRLLCHPQVIATPHLGASTDEAQHRVAMQLAEQVRDFFLTGTISNAINVPSLSTSELAAAKPSMDMAFTLALLAAQLSDKRVHTLSVHMATPLDKSSQAPIVHAAIAGFLSARRGTGFSWLLAPYKASSIGLTVVESSSAHSGPATVTVTLTGDGHETVIKGALFAGKGPRIVELDGYDVEAQLSDHMVIIHNQDVPGVIGQVGTCLGRHGVNISRMQLGLTQDNTAISIWNLDHPLTQAPLQKIRALPSIDTATFADLSLAKRFQV